MISRADLKQQAKDSMRGRMGLAIGTMLLAIVITAVPGIVPFIGTIVSWLISGCISLSLAIFWLSFSNGGGDISDLSFGFTEWKRSTSLMLWQVIFIGLWSLLFCIPGLIKAIAYSQAFFIMSEDKDITPRQALKKSQEMMMGYKMDYFILGLSFLGWLILSGFTFGLLFLWLGPYMATTYANFYKAVRGPLTKSDNPDVVVATAE